MRIALGLLVLAMSACQTASGADCMTSQDCGEVPCELRVCSRDFPDQVSGHCQSTPRPYGSAPIQVQGDCKLTTCDGNGNAIDVIDDQDVPNIPNSCIVSTCYLGAPQTTFAQADTTCGTGVVCNATGECVECNGPVECPGTDNTCQARTCIDGACGMTYVDAGKILVTTAGNCHATQCDGAGNGTSVVDDANVATTTNKCITPTCSNGTPGSTNKPAGTPCGTGHTCNGLGTCI